MLNASTSFGRGREDHGYAYFGTWSFALLHGGSNHRQSAAIFQRNAGGTVTLSADCGVSILGRLPCAAMLGLAR
jgi:hypothetical protein